MKIRYFFTCIFLVVVGTSVASAQSSQQQGTKPTKQSQSHQMFQPKPTVEKGPDLSKERIDEIQELFELAKKELESKVQQPKTSP